tara:strand:- start:805 stop:1422 length:618 start_codon:yes stop_codon:yes gene_type:complete
MSNLLREFNSFGEVQILNEGKGGKPMKIRGLFSEAEAVNGNKRIYSRKLLERECQKLGKMISERRLVGELDHPTNEVVSLSNASHLITGLAFEGNKIIGEAEVLNTPSGKVLQELLKSGVQVGISSRATGSLEQDMHEDCYRVQDNLKMITWDMVSDPSCQGAFPTLSEGMLNEKRDPIVQGLDHHKQERIYITALKNTLQAKNK